MLYPIVIEEGSDDTAFGVAVPDLPGCFSAGDSLEEAVDNARQAAAAWIDAALDKGMAIPKASSLNEIRSNPDYAGWAIGLINVEDTLLDDTIERINITLPRRVLRRLDDMAKAEGQSRGGLITRLTLTARKPAHSDS